MTGLGPTFDIVEWKEEPSDEPEVGPSLTRVTVKMYYRGLIKGTGTAHVLTVQGEQSGYREMARVERLVA